MPVLQTSLIGRFSDKRSYLSATYTILSARSVSNILPRVTKRGIGLHALAYLQSGLLGFFNGMILASLHWRGRIPSSSEALNRLSISSLTTLRIAFRHDQFFFHPRRLSLHRWTNIPQPSVIVNLPYRRLRSYHNNAASF